MPGAGSETRSASSISAQSRAEVREEEARLEHVHLAIMHSLDQVRQSGLLADELGLPGHDPRLTGAEQGDEGGEGGGPRLGGRWQGRATHLGLLSRRDHAPHRLGWGD